ncbi:MAG: hypothetical protein JO033_27265, partial [Acidobacteriaceae bacterium]|nr:hypothetical protein [Acidobacteriaceae bacterium]
MLSGWDVDVVQIRAYGVNDRVEFFRQLEESYSFGSRPPRVGVKRTLLEHIHDWKRGLRREI